MAQVARPQGGVSRRLAPDSRIEVAPLITGRAATQTFDELELLHGLVFAPHHEPHFTQVRPG